MRKNIIATIILIVVTFTLTNISGAEAPQILDTRKIQIGKQVLRVEVADSPEERRKGLMYRESLQPNEGMFFIFEEEKQQSFWMKNTFIPLSLGFFNKEKVLVEITTLEPSVMGERKIPQYKSQKRAKYVLEVKKGWFKKHKIKPKQKFKWLPKEKTFKDMD